ncbi:MAG TPA: fumarylacetoacetate hydrolase family protein [Caulobacteraceae bacterium]|jgi:2-keto-4-pentenoate hydratase/2-oxohepta-3-ene-1,7-dioic acid hydratase in catechol pathway|nr:fumarylacetoacetate hydrolase family protein [Caulobacteraceae bacterium]
MKLVTFQGAKGPRAGVVLEDSRYLCLATAAEKAGVSLDATSLLAVVQAGPTALAAVKSLAARAAEFPEAVVAASSVKLRAPILKPERNVFCVGLNYVDHVAEGHRARKTEMKLPEVPTFFTKANNTINDPDAPVRLDPKLTTLMDYEVELAVIIGKGGRDITAAQAMDHVFGYTIANDVTDRVLQRKHLQWFKGKSLDTTLPMGPWIVTADEIGDPETLEISLTVNGQQRQRAKCSQMIFDIPTIIESLSAGMTLEAGDVIITGTPQGVGFAMDPPQGLHDGDVMVLTIDRIGTLTNTIKEV